MPKIYSKVKWPVLVSAALGFVVTVLSQFGVEVPLEVVAGLETVLIATVGYMVPETHSDTKPLPPAG